MCCAASLCAVLKIVSVSGKRALLKHEKQMQEPAVGLPWPNVTDAIPLAWKMDANLLISQQSQTT